MLKGCLTSKVRQTLFYIADTSNPLIFSRAKYQQPYFSSRIQYGYYSESPFEFVHSDLAVVQKRSNSAVLGFFATLFSIASVFWIAAANNRPSNTSSTSKPRSSQSNGSSPAGSIVSPTTFSTGGLSSKNGSSPTGSIVSSATFSTGDLSLKKHIPSSVSESDPTSELDPALELESKQIEFFKSFIHEGKDRLNPEYHNWENTIKQAPLKQKKIVLRQILDTNYIERTKNWRVFSLFVDAADTAQKKEIIFQLITMLENQYRDPKNFTNRHANPRLWRRHNGLFATYQAEAANILNTVIFDLFLEKGLSLKDFNERAKDDLRSFIIKYYYLMRADIKEHAMFPALLCNLATDPHHIETMNSHLEVRFRNGHFSTTLIPKYGTVSFPPLPIPKKKKFLPSSWRRTYGMHITFASCQPRKSA
jgi:hypothetical protein